MTKKILIAAILGLTFNTLVYSQISQSFKISKVDWGKNYRLTGYAKANDSLTVQFMTAQRTVDKKFIKDKFRKNETEKTTAEWAKFLLTGKIQKKCESLVVWIWCAKNMKEFNLDDISLEIGEDDQWTRVKIKNGDFELNSDSIGLIPSWKVFPNYTVTTDPSQKHLGEQSIRLVQNDLSKYGTFKEHGNVAKINGIYIYYEIYGQGEPLLLLHGNNESISSFSNQIDEFKKHYKVITVDSRGQGNSSIDKQKMTYDLLASDIESSPKNSSD